MTTRQTGASLISQVLSFILPLVLAAYWPFFGTGHAVHAGVIIIRLIALAGVALLSLLWVSGKITPAEFRWTVILGSWLCILFIQSLLGEELSRGIHNWLRVLPVYCIAILLARPLRHEPTRKAFGIALASAGLISFLFIIAIYLHYAGLNLPSYEHIRIFKTIVQRSSGVALNPLAFATLLFCVLSLCLLRSGLWQWTVTAAIAILGSALTGSRAPIVLTLSAAAALLLMTLLHHRTIALRVFGAAVLCCSLLAGAVGAILVTPQKLSRLTEGRSDLWTVGVDKFLERPLTGYGPESWRDGLGSSLPGYYGGGLATLRAGGYHSEFVTLLSEGGLLCFIPAILIFGLLFHACCRLAFRSSLPRFNGQALIFAFFLIFFRGFIEVPGMFGYGEDVTDYLAAVFVAIVVSQLSLLAKRATPVQHASAIPFGRPRALEHGV